MATGHGRALGVVAGRDLMSAPLANIKASHSGLSLDEIFVKKVAAG